MPGSARVVRRAARLLASRQTDVPERRFEVKDLARHTTDKMPLAPQARCCATARSLRSTEKSGI